MAPGKVEQPFLVILQFGTKKRDGCIALIRNEYPVESRYGLEGRSFGPLGLLFADDVTGEAIAKHLGQDGVAAFLELLHDAVVQRVLVLLQPPAHAVPNGACPSELIKALL